MNSKLIPIFFLWAGILASGGCFSSNTDSEGKEPLLPEYLRVHGEIKVGIGPECPPFLYRKDGQWQGLEIDLINELAASCNLKTELMVYNQAELLSALRRGEVDLIAGDYTDWTIIRNFLQPCARHLPTGQRLVVRQDIAVFLSKLDQLNKPEVTVLTVIGSSGAELADDVLPKTTRVSTKDLTSAVERLKKEKGAVLMVSARKAWELSTDPNNNLTTVFALYGSENIAWGIRTGTHLREQAWELYLNHFINRLRENGRLRQLIRRHEVDLLY